MKKIKLLFIVLVFISTQLLPTNASENSSSSQSTTKEESIYGLLNYDGSLNTLYIINALNNEITDYGNYDRIDNLTTLDQLVQNGDEILLPTTSKTFYYQGTMNKAELPWDFNITYLLNGNPIDAKDLAMASGDLSIQIKVKKGPLANQSFYDGFALQISLALSDELCKDIIAEGATIVEAGGTKQISFTVLPGNDAEFVIKCKVNDFTMDPISINGVKMLLDFNVDTSSFTDQINLLTDAINQLDDGAIQLKEGIATLSNGFSTYTEGLKTYSDALGNYAAQGKTLSSGLSDISKGMKTLTDKNDTLKLGIEGIEAATFHQVDVQLAAMGLSMPPLTKENYKQILSGQDGFIPLLTQLEQTLQLTSGLIAYVDGAAQLASGTEQISQGLNQYVVGADKLAESAKQLYDGAVEINAGIEQLNIGIKLYQGGTSEFKNSTSDLKSEINDQIDTMLAEFTGKNTELVSYASSKNTNIQSVQFFFRTQSIKAPKAVETKIPEPKKSNFWSRLLKLFGL